MSDEAGDGHAFGTAAPDETVTRADFERALRHLNLTDLELRDAIMQLGARVVTLIDELTRRVDGVEPEPAPPGTPATAAEHTVETAVAANLPETLAAVRAADARGRWRVSLDTGGSKYEAEPSTPPCDEVLHLCQARCCSFDFALSTEDLDEGVIRWDYGQPYLIRQRASDRYCVHNDPDARRCTVHHHRPRTCRVYDCTNDPRVWIDFARRVPAPMEAARIQPEHAPETGFELLARVRARAAAVTAERGAMASSWADAGPRRAPPPPRRG
jgi:Fe-S-cluster containining protein